MKSEHKPHGAVKIFHDLQNLDIAHHFGYPYAIWPTVIL